MNYESLDHIKYIMFSYLNLWFFLIKKDIKKKAKYFDNFHLAKIFKNSAINLQKVKKTNKLNAESKFAFSKSPKNKRHLRLVFV